MELSEDSRLSRLESEFHALAEVAKVLTLPLELSELLQAVLEKIKSVLEPAQAGVIMLWDQPAGLFRPVASFGFDWQILKNIGLRRGESITGKVFAHDKAFILNGPDQVEQAMTDMRPANRAAFQRALSSSRNPIGSIAAPLTAGNHRYGVLVLMTIYGPAFFTEEDLSFLQVLADLIALAIGRAHLEEKADAIREARQAEQMRSEIMATLSHQLRMPLSAIKGYASALLLDEIQFNETKRRDFLEMIDEESDNMQVMITELLDSSLIDVGQLSLEPQPVRLQKIAQEVANEVQRRTDLHRLVVDFGSDFPILDLDPYWIKQVFRNILDNSVKYSPEGGLIVIRGELRPNDILVSIADQGIGISPEDLIPLFEKYFRAKTGKGYHVTGTGLGLPVARAIVEAHGGHIWAESKLCQGTTLFFSLPLPKSNQGDET